MNIRDRVGATATPPPAAPNPPAVATPACQDKQAMKAVIRVLLGLFALSVCLTLAAPTVSAQPAASSSPSQAVTAFIPVSNLPAWPVLGQGSNSDWPRSTVRSLQYLLNARGAHLVVDGFFGPRTDAAVRSYQRTHGLVVDGIVGARTWSALIVTVQRGSVGPAVKALQDQGNARADGGGASTPVLAVDGIFGPRTERWVQGFQEAIAPHVFGFPVDGIVGPLTWSLLITGENPQPLSSDH
jgi:Putative peptidoglycan-binding domain-containing protein